MGTYKIIQCNLHTVFLSGDKKKIEKKKVPKNAISAHLRVTDDQQPIPAAWVMTDDLPLGDAGSRGDDR